jgi:hypothetical protein
MELKIRQISGHRLRHLEYVRALISQGFFVSGVCALGSPAPWTFPHLFGYFRNALRNLPQSFNATGIDEQGYESCEWRKQNQPPDDNCPAPGKTTVSLETAATEQAQHKNAHAMSYQIDYEVH